MKLLGAILRLSQDKYPGSLDPAAVTAWDSSHTNPHKHCTLIASPNDPLLGVQFQKQPWSPSFGVPPHVCLMRSLNPSFPFASPLLLTCLLACHLRKWTGPCQQHCWPLAQGYMHYGKDTLHHGCLVITFSLTSNRCLNTQVSPWLGGGCILERQL